MDKNALNQTDHEGTEIISSVHALKHVIEFAS